VSVRGDIAGGSVDATMLARADGSLARLGDYRWATYGAAFSPDGAKVAAGGNDRVLRVWDVTTGAELAALERKQHPEGAARAGGDDDEDEGGEPEIGSVAWAGEGIVASYDDGLIVRWRLDPPRIDATWKRTVSRLVGDGSLAIVVVEGDDDADPELADAVEEFLAGRDQDDEDVEEPEDEGDEDEEADEGTDDDEGDDDEEGDDEEGDDEEGDDEGDDDEEGDDKEGDDDEEREDEPLVPAPLDGSGTMVLLEVATGRVVAVFSGLPRGPGSFALRRDGQVLASTEYPRTLRLWDVASGGCLGAAILPAGRRVFDPHLPVAFGPDDALWCGDNTGAIHRLDPSTLAPLRSVRMDRDGAFAMVTTNGVTTLGGDEVEGRRHAVALLGPICLPGDLAS
jgi:WD40 repeat protein